MSEREDFDQESDYIIIDQLKPKKIKRPPDHLFKAQLFSLHIVDYKDHMKHRKTPMLDCVIRVVISESGLHCDFGRITNMPVWLIDSLLDRCSNRQQHSPISWGEALDILGIFAIDETDFRYSIFVDQSRVQVLTLVVGCFSSKSYLAHRYLHGNYDHALDHLKYEHLIYDDSYFEDSSVSDNDELVMDVDEKPDRAVFVRHVPFRTRRYQKHHE